MAKQPSPSKKVTVKVSGKMSDLDGNKVRANQKATGSSYTFVRSKPGTMSSSDSSYVNKFSKSNQALAVKKKGGAIKAKRKK